MKSIKVLLGSIISFLFFTAGSCEKKQQNSECPPNTSCTMMFASIGTKITDNKGEPVKFTEVYTLRKSNGEILTYHHNAIEGFYLVVDDSYQKSLANQTETFRLIGKKDGKAVMDELFVISADCCHVNKLSGKSEIIIP